MYNTIYTNNNVLILTFRTVPRSCWGLNHTNKWKMEPLVRTCSVPTLNHAAILFFLTETVQLGASVTIRRRLLNTVCHKFNDLNALSFSFVKYCRSSKYSNQVSIEISKLIVRPGAHVVYPQVFGDCVGIRNSLSVNL